MKLIVWKDMADYLNGKRMNRQKSKRGLDCSRQEQWRWRGGSYGRKFKYLSTE